MCERQNISVPVNSNKATFSLACGATMLYAACIGLWASSLVDFLLQCLV